MSGTDPLAGLEITVDKLIAGPSGEVWSLHQLRKGHRFSTDDLVTAWRALRARPDARRLLDLGCGIGSVGLTTLARLPADATLVGVEAQAISHALLRRTLAHQGLEGRVTAILGDLRDPSVFPDERFPLITGSPPYVPVGHGLPSQNSQRAHARIELRGSVFDYCAAAARHLAPGGRFVYVMAAQDPRTEAAPGAHGLAIEERWEYVFGRGRVPHIATIVCGWPGDVGPRRDGRLVIRGDDGEWSEDYQAFRREMGVEVPGGRPRPAAGAAGGSSTAW